MAKLQLIKTILREKNLSIRDFSNVIGVTEQGLQRMIRENSTKVETLESIARTLNVSIGVFFDDDLFPRQSCSNAETNVSMDFPKLVFMQAETILSQQRTIESLSHVSKKAKVA